jgi:hypothetical protein
MKNYRYIGETDEMTTYGKVYQVGINKEFIDDLGEICSLGNDYKKYFEEIKPDSIVESVINQFKERSKVGIEKYGVTLDRKDLNFLDWVNHAQQEAMDFILYLEKLKHEKRD